MKLYLIIYTIETINGLKAAIYYVRALSRQEAKKEFVKEYPDCHFEKIRLA